MRLQYPSLAATLALCFLAGTLAGSCADRAPEAAADSADGGANVHDLAPVSFDALTPRKGAAEPKAGARGDERRAEGAAGATVAVATEAPYPSSGGCCPPSSATARP